MAGNPQTLFLALAGLHMLDDDQALSGASIVFVLKRLGVGESAARSVLQRNSAKGFIVRHKAGRKTFYTLSERAREILRGGQQKMFAGWRPREWDGQWTFVRVQVPETKRALRHRLAAKLSWAGFGQLEGGIWVVPGRHDAVSTLGSEAAEFDPIVIHGAPQPPTTDAKLVGAFELDGLAAEYLAFADKWRDVVPDSLQSIDALLRRVELHVDWLTLTRVDPQLPTSLLPGDWPGPIQAERFRDLNECLGKREESVRAGFFAGDLSRT